MAFPRAKSKASPVVSNSGSITNNNSMTLMSMSTNNPTPNASSSRIASKNPWDNENPYIKDALILAEQMNIKTLENESHCAKAIAELPSSELISLQREITEKKKTITRLKQEISTHRLQIECHELLHLDTIEKRINMLKQMCNDLDTVLRNKEKLITRLQTPFVGDFIKVEADYHKYFHEVLLNLVPTIINISPYLDNVSWLGHRDLSAGLTEPLMVEIQSLMASLQTSYQMLCQMKSGIGQIRQREEHEGGFEPADT